MAERTFPSAGKSPIDGYLAPVYATNEIGIPAGYFAIVPTGGSAGYCNALYALVDLGTDEKVVKGRTAAIEAKVKLGVSSGACGHVSCLCLDYENECEWPQEFGHSYILLRERSSAGIQRMNKLFHFMDISPSTTANTALLTTSGAGSQTHAIRIWCGASTPLWIMVTETPPAGA